MGCVGGWEETRFAWQSVREACCCSCAPCFPQGPASHRAHTLPSPLQKGAGHEVPMFQPLAALSMAAGFVKGAFP